MRDMLMRFPEEGAIYEATMAKALEAVAADRTG